MTVFRSISTAAVLASCLLAGACSKSSASKPDPAKAVESAAVAVSTVTVAKADVAVPIIATGSLTPSKQTDVGPAVDGIIESVAVHVGSRVRKGDVLFKTRDVDIRLQVQEMEKQVALARAQLANTQNELRRQNALKGGGWVSASRMDTTRTNSDVAAAQLGVWEARLAQARQALKDTVVRAPYDGVISRKDVYEGRFMATRFGGIGGASGVVQIMAIDPLAVIVVAPSNHFSDLKVGMKGRIFVDGIEKPFEGTVAVINYGVDYKARSVEVRLALPNRDYKILPGLYARVELMPPSRPALVADRKAILGPDGARYAFIKEGDRAKKVSVSVKDLDGERVEILSNVPDGTQLLSGPNLPLLVDGVTVKTDTMPDTTGKPATTQAKL